MAKPITLFILLLISFATSAQQLVKGTIKDKEEHKPVTRAIVSLIRPKDSILVKFTRTDTAGNFTLKHIPYGQYIMMVSHPAYGDLLEDVTIGADGNNLAIQLIPKAKLLEEIVIRTASPTRIKGDTTIFLADSFIVSPNADVSELLKKLPGLRVDKDGKITAMGKTVEKVLVDGEEFFGTDPGMAVKNLRADAVKEVQVFDKKSEQAEFTGIDDGQTQKTINLKLKDNAKRGYFGKVSLEAGPMEHIPNRYNSNLMFSSFRGQRKVSAFILNGNTGQDGLDWQDQMQFGGLDATVDVSGDGISIFSMRGSEEEPYINTRYGFMTNNNAGLQYFNKWNNKYSFNFTPRYNNQQYNNRTGTFTQTQVGDSVINQNTTTDNSINRYNFQLKGKWDLQLDSMNTIKVNALAGFYHSESESDQQSFTTGYAGTLKNKSKRDLSTVSDKSVVSGDITLQHKFRKARRTLSVSTAWKQSDNKSLSYLQSQNQSYLGGSPIGSQDIDQQKDGNGNTRTTSMAVIYTEPLNKALSMELGYSISYNSGTNSQVTRAYSSGSGKYDNVVDSLTNDFEQQIWQHTPTAKINFANKKWKINVGSGFGITSYQLADITEHQHYNRSYVNFFPSSNITYTYKANHKISLGYSGSTSQPTINQLQPLRNNDDYFNQYIGNADLRPSFTHTFNLSHDSYNFMNGLYSYMGGNITFAENAITNHQYINLDSGKTITQPVNINGNIYAFLFGGMGFKIKPLNASIDINSSIDYNRYVGLLNNRKTYSKSFSPSIRAGITKDKEFKYSIRIYDGITYNYNSTSENNNTIRYITNKLGIETTLYYRKNWSIHNDYTYVFQQKAQPSEKNLNYHPWNIRLQRTFSQNRFTAYLSVRDLLNQNIGSERRFYGTTYTETNNESLKRYFLLGFTWNFKNKNTGSK